MFKRKDVLIILWMTFITIVAWVGFHIYHIIVTSTITEELQLQITSIDPNFDMNTINALKNRERIDPLYQFNANSVENTASPTASILISPTGSINPGITGGP